MSRLISKTKEMFGFDLRSLAFFRMAIAVCIIGDFWSRSSDLAAHYTDAGLLPRVPFLQFFSGDWSISLNLISGRWEVQALLFGLAIFFGVMMFVGYRTRLATFMCWLFILSIQNRNPMLNQGGDTLFRMVLFWAIFLPLGARCSLDHFFSKDHGRDLRTNNISMGSFAYIVQIALLYWVTAAIKLSGYSKIVWWDQGMAVYNALSVDQFARPMGLFLLGFPGLLKITNYATILFEIAGPFLFFMPIFTGVFRLAGVIFFIVMHLGFASCLYIGTFTWIGCVSVLPMLPGIFWDKAGRCFTGGGNGVFKILFQAKDKFQEGLLDLRKSPSLGRANNPELAQNAAILRRGAPLLSWGGHAVAAAALAFVMFWNLGTVNSHYRVPFKLQPIGLLLGLDQYWNMFSPPLTDDGWYVIPGHLRDGTEIDLFKAGREGVDWNKPKYVYKTYKNARWQKYMMNLWLAANQQHRLYYGQYLCRNWNTKHTGQEQLVDFEIFFMLEMTQSNVTKIPKKTSVWKHYCFG